MKYGALAQLVAHNTGSVGVRGSNPLRSTKNNRPVQKDGSVILLFNCKGIRTGSGGHLEPNPACSAEQVESPNFNRTRFLFEPERADAKKLV